MDCPRSDCPRSAWELANPHGANRHIAGDLFLRRVRNIARRLDEALNGIKRPVAHFGGCGMDIGVVSECGPGSRCDRCRCLARTRTRRRAAMILIDHQRDPKDLARIPRRKHAADCHRHQGGIFRTVGCVDRQHRRTRPASDGRGISGWKKRRPRIGLHHRPARRRPAPLRGGNATAQPKSVADITKV